ncbi:MAG: HEPN domain-containing protein [bacterium]
MPDSMYFKDWLDKAHNDLLAAEAILAYFEEPPTDTVCYHCHQVAEKCFKAFIIAKTNALKKIHELIELPELCIAVDKSFEEFRASAENSYRYYIDAKYPPGVPVWYPLEEAKIAFDQARDILAFTRKKLTTDQPEETK